VPLSRLQTFLARIEAGEYPSWEALHAAYRGFSASYPDDRLGSAWSILGYLYPSPGRKGPSPEGLASALGDLAKLGEFVETAVFKSRAKDWSNSFRKATYRSEAEMIAVLGRPEDNGFVRKTNADMEALRAKIRGLAGS
jgi:hypothetical protein